MGGLTLETLRRMLESLPPHPVAPENRNWARLQPSMYIPRGSVYRIVPPWVEMDRRHTSTWRRSATEEERPVIVLHPLDLEQIRREFTYGTMPPGDQYIADMFEQIFAEREAKGL